MTFLRSESDSGIVTPRACGPDPEARGGLGGGGPWGWLAGGKARLSCLSQGSLVGEALGLKTLGTTWNIPSRVPVSQTSLADVYAKALWSPGLWLYLSCAFFSPSWINKTFSVTTHLSGNVPTPSGQGSVLITR